MHKYDLRYVYSKPNKLKTIFIRVFFTILVFVVFFLLANTVYANGANPDNKPDLNATTHGSVWLLPSDGVYIEALQLETKVKMRSITLLLVLMELIYIPFLLWISMIILPHFQIMEILQLIIVHLEFISFQHTRAVVMLL